MADLDRIKRNVSKMAGQNAPVEDIDGYLQSEGVTVDQIKAHKVGGELQHQKEQFHGDYERRARAQAADERVAKERAEQGPAWTGTRDVLRNIATGTPVGSWLDEANAGLSQAVHTVTGGRRGEPYQDRMDYQAATDRATERDTTRLGKIPGTDINITGQGLTMLAGGVASAPFAPMARPFQGAALLPQAGNAMLTGAGYGTAYGAGVGQGFEERGTNAVIGLGTGAFTGFATPFVAAGAGRAVNAMSNRMLAPPAELAGIDRRAARLVSEDMEAGGLFNPNSPNNYNWRAQQLGDEGMISDMSRRTQAAAGGVANAEGPGGQIITDAITHRRSYAPDRINRELDTALGAPQNTIDFERNLRRHYSQQADPYYQDFYSRNIPITPSIRGILRRAQASGAVREAQKIMEIEGVDPRRLSRLVDDEMTPMTGLQRRTSERVPNGQEFDYIKRGIDDAARRAEPGSNQHRLLTELARRLRNEVDEVLSPGAPDQSPWAQGRAIAEEGFGVRDGLELGRQVFQRNMTPDQLGAELQGMSQMEREAVMMAARQDLRGRMGSSAAAYGATPDVAGRRTLNSGDAREKLAMVAGGPEARQVARRIDAENTFANTDQRVLNNSVTAERSEAIRRYRPPIDSQGASNLRGMSLVGGALEVGNRILNALFRGAIDERRMRTLIDAGRLYSATGADRDQFARGLMDLARRRGANQQQMSRIEAVAQRLLEGGRSTAVSAAVGE